MGGWETVETWVQVGGTYCEWLKKATENDPRANLNFSTVSYFRLDQDQMWSMPTFADDDYLMIRKVYLHLNSFDAPIRSW